MRKRTRVYRRRTRRTKRFVQEKRRVRPGQRGFVRVGGFYGRYSNGGELKFHDVDLDDAVVANGGTITPSINLIAQGVTESTRIGRKCTLKNIGWHYVYSMPEITAAGSPPPFDNLRIILYIDKQANGATATVLNILETADFQSFNNLSNSGRFRTLMDKTFTLNYRAGAGITASSDYPSVTFKGSFYKRCNIPLEFDNTTGAITEIRSNNIGVLLISSASACGFASKFRLRFSDS